jgi:Amidohydrolase
VGVVVVVLAATHVLFLTLHAWGDALDLYLPSSGWSRFSGVVALVLPVGFVVASLIGRLAYPTFVSSSGCSPCIHARRLPHLRGARHVLTIYVPDRPALEAVNHMTSVRHIVFGSDWPFAERRYPNKGDPQPALSRAFSNRERRAIDRLNARREFRRVAKVVPGTR